MEREFIIDGKRIIVRELSIKMKEETDDITQIGSQWIQYEYTGLRRIVISGKIENEQIINQEFRLKGMSDDGLMVIESLKEQPVVGETE